MIENKVIASSAIGEARARYLASRGAKLMLGARGETTGTLPISDMCG